jgi:ribosomal protein S20
MDIKEIKKRIKEIKGKTWDNEVAHDMENLLYKDFIKSIANGDTDNIQEKAKLILTTKNIKFTRWYA